MEWKTGKPEAYGVYIVTLYYHIGNDTYSREVDVVYYGKDGWDRNGVVAYMPFPKPYRGDKYGLDIGD